MAAKLNLGERRRVLSELKSKSAGVLTFVPVPEEKIDLSGALHEGPSAAIWRGVQCGESAQTESRYQQSQANPVQTADRQPRRKVKCIDALGRGLVIDVNMKGAGDWYQAQRDCEFLSSVLLGQHIFARHLLGCSVTDLHHILQIHCINSNAFLERLRLQGVMATLREQLMLQHQGGTSGNNESLVQPHHLILAVDELQNFHMDATQAGQPTTPMDIANDICDWCQGESLSEGDIRCAILVGTGFSFCDFTLTRKFNFINLKLPNLTECGRQELLVHQLCQFSLPESDVQGALEDRSLQSLCADTMGIPRAVIQLMQVVVDHYGKGHEIGREQDLLKADYIAEMKQAVQTTRHLVATLRSPEALVSIALMMMSGLTFDLLSQITEKLDLGLLQQNTGILLHHGQATG
ncbi:hypothetical protein WJX84_009441 [Apatococcus fuscideae]|uniref:NR LBD domain-containing protein n=1 Tax=Apatococcus fuscideae TaxID=2026836 RepID=A0AAW1SQC4_9CHLO